MAFQRHDENVGKDAAGRRKGDFLWHSYAPIANQMVVLEQFHSLPVLLFSARYPESVKGGFGSNRWVAMTLSMDRKTGKMVYDPISPRLSNGAPEYYAFTIDVKDGSINMIGYQGTVRHYVDDGRPRLEVQGKAGPDNTAPPTVGAFPGGGRLGGCRPVRPRPIIRQPVIINPPPVQQAPQK
jgi:hypothetical protein